MDIDQSSNFGGHRCSPLRRHDDAKLAGHDFVGVASELFWGRVTKLRHTGRAAATATALLRRGCHGRSRA